MRKIIINERQEMLLMNTILNESYIEAEGPKILAVKKYLDDTFKKGSSAMIDADGNPSKMEVVVMMQGNKPLKSMDDKQLFYHIQSHDKFRNMFSSEERDKFLKKVIKAWYYNKINPKTGNIMP